MLQIQDKYELIDMFNHQIIEEQFTRNEIDYLIDLIEKDIEREEEK